MLHNLMNNGFYGEKLENRIVVNLESNEKNYLKWTSKPGYMSHEIFDNGLVAIIFKYISFVN